jgi:hypothetical protein
MGVPKPDEDTVRLVKDDRGAKYAKMKVGASIREVIKASAVEKRDATRAPSKNDIKRRPSSRYPGADQGFEAGL